MKYLVILLSLITVALSETNYSAQYTACLDNAMTDSDMSSCTYLENKVQDKLLNKNYRMARKLLGKNKRAELKKVQRTWLKYRDAKCNFYSNLTGGTMDSLNQSGCLLEITAERAEELAGFGEL